MTDLSAYLDAVRAQIEQVKRDMILPYQSPSQQSAIYNRRYTLATRDLPAMVAVLRDIERLCDEAEHEDEPDPRGPKLAFVMTRQLRAALSSLTPDTPRSE